MLWKESEIKVVHFNHRGEPQYGLHFKYNEKIKSHLLVLDGIRWSKTRGCFYIPSGRKQLNDLLNHCRGIIWVDLTGLTHVKSKPKDAKTVTIKENSRNDNQKKDLEPETVKKIEKMQAWMQQKRYSYSTIKTYLSFVCQFFLETELRWDALTIEVISQYNCDEFITKKKSYSSQNQWINAIKLFIKVNGPANIDLDNIERPRKEQRLPYVLAPEEVIRILACTPNLKHKTLLMLIYSAGLRIGEALDLRLQDIRRKEGLIYIRPAMK